jgi:hypothetical protein
MIRSVDLCNARSRALTLAKIAPRNSERPSAGPDDEARGRRGPAAALHPLHVHWSTTTLCHNPRFVLLRSCAAGVADLAPQTHESTGSASPQNPLAQQEKVGQIIYFLGPLFWRHCVGGGWKRWSEQWRYSNPSGSEYLIPPVGFGRGFRDSGRARLRTRAASRVLAPRMYILVLCVAYVHTL